MNKLYVKEVVGSSILLNLIPKMIRISGRKNAIQVSFFEVETNTKIYFLQHVMSLNKKRMKFVKLDVI